MNLEGRVALVTGANRGLGKAIAIDLARKGAAVAVQFYSDEARANEVANEINNNDGSGFAVQADVTSRDDVNKMIEVCNERAGAIDILVNGARQLGAKKPFLELGWSDYEQQIDVIVKGAFNCCQAVLPAMIRQKNGRIINLLSTVLGEPNWRWHTYAAAKAALHMFSRNLAAEMGPVGITVNMVSPGFVPTDRQTPHNDDYQQEFLKLTPMERFGRPEEIADAVSFLASDQAAFITGANVPVCGGKVMF